METKKKKYVANGKQVKDYDMVNFSLSLDKLDPENVYEFKGKQYINLTISKNKYPDKYGYTHSIYINEFKKEEKDTSISPESVSF